jgi:hypothetical protein
MWISMIAELSSQVKQCHTFLKYQLNFILSVTAEIFAWGEWGELIIQGIRI